MSFKIIDNHQAVPVSTIPELAYDLFMDNNIALMENHPERHCVLYFGYRENKVIHLICCVADDLQHNIMVSSSTVISDDPLGSFTAKNLCFEKFEREIHENFGIEYIDHPWLKPVRYAENRADKSKIIPDYPFFNIESEELHEVGVGPVHAGIIEPGHFRFVCNGEQILHLEIQLGYQHRGIEQLFIDKKKLIQKTTLAESIAGDSVVGHTTAFSYLWESLSGSQPGREILYSRTIAQELERIAVQTGDLSGIWTEVAYQLGGPGLCRVRMQEIYFFREWGGHGWDHG